MTFFIVALSLQGIATLVDEFYFHRQRGLPRWERIGHPIDTFSVLICFVFLVMVDQTPTSKIIYIVLASLSCLCITKDEWVHKKICPPEELWLHSILFILHPIVLFSAMQAWERGRPEILAAAGVVFTFMVYQILYWSVLQHLATRAQQKARYRDLKQDELYEYFGE